VLLYWPDAGGRAIEEVLARDPRTERFCYGNRLTIADICLVAHLTGATRYGRRAHKRRRHFT
jgi:glutathione S-transferase